VGQEARKRALEVRCPVTVPREVGSLSRMKDDRTNIIVSQQRRDLVFGDWTSATIFVPRRVLFRGARAQPAPDRRHRKLLVAIGEGAGGADAVRSQLARTVIWKAHPARTAPARRGLFVYVPENLRALIVIEGGFGRSSLLHGWGQQRQGLESAYFVQSVGDSSKYKPAALNASARIMSADIPTSRPATRDL